MKLMVGCPLRDRTWILPSWFEHVELALKRTEITDPRFVFVGSSNDPSIPMAVGECWQRSWDVSLVEVWEESQPYQREWNRQRYQHMVDLRNALLGEVRRWGPEFFWSLDSDILVPAAALELSLDALANRDWAAVGQRCFMTPDGTTCPSYAMLANGGALLRPDAPGCFPVDVIMASKVMTLEAYTIDYSVHDQGEDIGWSINCRNAGLTLGWDGRSVGKHVMEPSRLDRYDPRCEF